MSYADRLKAQIVAKGAPRPTDKTDRGANVSYVSALSGPFQRTLTTETEAAEIRAHLGRLCGFDHPDYPEALSVALADPVAALDALRNPSARMLAAMEGG